jgi:cytochrome oxidase Cu insertion factor (SCO1/SenC/PrrC family)
VTSTEKTAATQSRWRGRSIPLLILGTIVLVILVSTLLFRAAVLGHIDLPALLGTRNNGVLISPPLPLKDLTIQTASGEAFDYSALPARWTVLIPVGSSCDAQCQQTLYLTRQIHIALGKNADRVRRFVLSTAYPLDAEFEKLLQQHPNMEVLKTDPAAFAQFFARAGSLQPLQNHLFFLVDPQGWVMMYYSPEHGGKAIMTDIKLLLANSPE